ncbi:MAG: DUF2285 domain-containing protein, partial [Anaerolineaceae bacterium]|nr:DUF2285 domain-containing protein [Anaerolineaceae bacterium]
VREDAALMTILDDIGTKKTQRDIAVEIWGEEDVAAEWTTGYWMRSQVRRWIRKAEALDGGGWRGLLPPADPEN